MESQIPTPLVTFEMANNHMGDVAHGELIIREFASIAEKFPDFCFAFKLQYRNLDTFIHPSVRNREDIKHVKRFNDTRLTRDEFDHLVSVIKDSGFVSMVTPFDEVSVNVIEEQGVEIIKIASCSFDDWPLLERIAKTNTPIIASTAGASVESIDAVVSFIKHRNKDFALLHCVAEYPASPEKMELGQIDFLRARYADVRIGFSTHEAPEDVEVCKLAVAKGADIFEKHVGVEAPNYSLNAYSASPEQAFAWLEAIRRARAICGQSSGRSPINAAEQESLISLRRGVFARQRIKGGSLVRAEDVYYAFPPEAGQLKANDMGKYRSILAQADIEPDAPILLGDLDISDDRERVFEIAGRVRRLIEESKITVPAGVDLEISHHYGLEKFDEFGLTMLTVVNRGYCKKLLVCLPGQRHPEQYHKQKAETFHVLYGELELELDGVKTTCKPGDVINVEPGVRHAFVSRGGAIIEEISSTHFLNDSFYSDEEINKNKNRKTLLTYWMT